MDQNHFWNLLAKKLSGEASPEELCELERLIKAYPDLTYAAQHIADLWQTNKDADLPAAEIAFQKHIAFLDHHGLSIEPQEHSSRGLMRKRLVPFSVAVLLIFILVGSVFFFGKPASISNKVHSSQASEVSTRMGNRTKLVLPDSSIVWLNAGSKLTYDPEFGITNRNTTLIGEAFFDVKKSSVPFIIHTNNLQVKVLGTAFNVKSYPNEKTTETSLIRGRVEITLDKRPGEKFILKPNEKLVVANIEEKERRESSKREPIVILKEITHVDEQTVLETSWVENKLIFHDESLEEVARKMERWYNVNIEIKEPGLAQLQVGGGPFENESIEQALTALQVAFGFKFSMKGNQITITR